MITTDSVGLKSYHYPPYTAPWGVAKREPNHFWDEKVGRFRAMSTQAYGPGRCTNAVCPHCTYMHEGVRRKRQ